MLNQRLRTLNAGYIQADRSAQKLSSTILKASVLAFPAATAIQHLSKTLFSQAEQQGKSLDALETRLKALRAGEQGVGLSREEHLQKLAGARQEIKALSSDLTLVQEGLAEAKQRQMVAAQQQAAAAAAREQQLSGLLAVGEQRAALFGRKVDVARRDGR